jgi:hypothetical protein
MAYNAEPKIKCYHVVIRLKDGVQPDKKDRRVCNIYLYGTIKEIRQQALDYCNDDEELGWLEEYPSKHIY